MNKLGVWNIQKKNFVWPYHPNPGLTITLKFIGIDRIAVNANSSIDISRKEGAEFLTCLSYLTWCRSVCPPLHVLAWRFESAC